MYKMHRLGKVGIAALTLALVLSACGGSDDDDSSSSSSSASSSVASSAASSESSSAASSESSSTASSESSSTATLDSSIWYYYDADVLPTTAGSIYVAGVSSDAFLDKDGVFADSGFTLGTGLVTFDTTSAAGSKARVYTAAGLSALSSYPKTVTMMAYVQVNDTSNRGVELDLYTGGDTQERIKAVVYSDGNGFGVEKVADASTTIKDSASYSGAYHLFQVDVNLTAACEGTVSLWVDGSEASLTSGTPTIGSVSGNVITLGGTGCQTAGSTDTTPYLYVGDGGSNSYNSTIDWIAWTTKGAYTPTEVAGSLPSALGTIPSNYQ